MKLFIHETSCFMSQIMRMFIFWFVKRCEQCWLHVNANGKECKECIPVSTILFKECHYVVQYSVECQWKGMHSWVHYSIHAWHVNRWTASLYSRVTREQPQSIHAWHVNRWTASLYSHVTREPVNSFPIRRLLSHAHTCTPYCIHYQAHTNATITTRF